MDTLTFILSKFNPVVNSKSPMTLTGINRTKMAQTLHELGFTVGAEVGVAEGLHAKVLCDNNPDLKLYGIDIWEKYPHYEEYADPDGCYVEAWKRLEKSNCQLIRKYSMDALSGFADNSLDFVYIDGAHDFKNVACDLVEWSRKVKPGGIVFGHDYKRSGSHSRHKLYVKDVVDAYMYSHDINPWFVLSNDVKDNTFGHDNPGWMFVRQEGDQI